MKNKRNIKSFEPEPDVAAMLERAQENGLELTEIVNTAMRECGRTVIAELARGRVRPAKARLEGLKKLAVSSFKAPELQLAGFAE